MGRRSYSSREVIERRPRITIQNLIDGHMLKQGPLSVSWESGVTETRGGLWSDEIARVKYTVVIDSEAPPIVGKIMFETKRKDYGETWSAHIIEAQAVHFGGLRYYFRCNICGRLVKALYYGEANRWDCRKCCGLVYESSRRHRDPFALQGVPEASRRKAAYLRAKGHPRLANRMEAKADEQERMYTEAWTTAAGRFIKRIRARHPGL